MTQAIGSTEPLPSPSRLRLGLAGLVIVAGLSLIWWGNGRPFQADSAAQKAAQQANAGHLETAIMTAEKADLRG